MATSLPDCVFCQIIAESADAAVVFRDDEVVAFLDVVPLFVGHTLIVPREHHVTLSDLPEDQVEGLFRRVRRMSSAMVAFGAEGSFVAMNNTVSQSVPHLHVHVVPRTKGDGLRGFFWPRTSYDSDEHRQIVASELGRLYELSESGEPTS